MTPSPIKRNFLLRRTTPLAKPQATINAHSKIRLLGHSEVSDVKRRIQALLRDIVMVRDGGCILRHIRCGHLVSDEGVVFQADHLIERSNCATYADTRLVVCVYKNCHGWKHFKKSNHDQYDALIRSILPAERVKLWDACQEDISRPHRTGIYDWKLAETILKSEVSSVVRL